MLVPSGSTAEAVTPTTVFMALCSATLFAAALPSVGAVTANSLRSLIVKLTIRSVALALASVATTVKL